VPTEVTTAPGIPGQSRYQLRLHRRRQARRRRVFWLFLDSPDPHHQAQAIRLQSCCSLGSHRIDPRTGESWTWTNRCASRLCPVCGEVRARELTRQLEHAIARMVDPAHVVLTYRHRTTPFREQHADLRRAVAALLKSREWRDRVPGGYYAVEAKMNADGTELHLHVHAIVDTPWLDQKLLSRIWSKHMDGGENVWISRIRDAEAAAHELAKYVAKPPRCDDWPDHAILDWFDATKHRRMLQAFGNCHGQALPKPEKPPAPDVQYVSISYPTIAHMAAAGEPHAQDLASILWTKHPWLRGYLHDVCPAAIRAGPLRTDPAHCCPRLPGGKRGRSAHLTDPNAINHLEAAERSTNLRWIADVAAGKLFIPTAALIAT